MMATGKRLLVAVVAVAVLGAGGLAAGEEIASILGMGWTPRPAPALVVSATGPVVFSESRPAPGVLVVDFANATVAGALTPVSEPALGLHQATITTAEEAGRRFVRLRVELEGEASATVSALPAGLEVRIGAAGVAAAPSSGELTEVLAVADDSGVSVMLGGGGRLDGKVFTLDAPARVVLDLPGVVNRVERRVHAVGAAGIQRVRVAQFATTPTPVVRVVVDLDQAMPYRFEPTARGAVLRVGGAPLTVAARSEAPAKPAPAPQPVAAPPKPAAEPPVVTAESRVEPTAAATPSRAEEPSSSLVSPPLPDSAPTVVAARPPADSPWTTTPRAMAEQAPPIGGEGASAREVESQERRFTGEPISLELKDADVKDVLRSFAKITGLNIVIDPDVSGSVTVNLENVPWDQCLDIILKINRLDYEVDNNVLRVARASRLRQDKAERALYLKDAESAQPMRTVTKAISYADPKKLVALLKKESFLLSDRGSVTVDERTATLVIRETSDRMEGVLNLIDQLDSPPQQVVIEARIVETTRNFSRALGVAWGFTGLGDAAHGTNTGWQFPNSYGVSGGVKVPIAGFGSADGAGSILAMTFADVLDSFNLDFALQAAESDGLAKVVSSPKVTAQNNEKAHIQSGVMIPIQTVANNTVTVQYIDATLSLDVTPHITAEGTVLLDIDLKKREPLGGLEVSGGRNAPISTRDARTNLMVRDGGTTVIGGIYQLTDNDRTDGIPGLKNIPLLGWLFKNHSISTQHDELLIFITPRILKY